ncbi:MAG: AraC family transcriptional regulator [Paenibacillus sp.]|nr:AraC family transcriptional regulator [Paenibacillus sp.]
MYFSMSRLSRLDAKWVDLFDVKHHTFYNQHHSPYFQLITVADGVVHLHVEGKRMSLVVGQSLLLKPWEVHGGWNPHDKNGRFYWVQFSCDPGLQELPEHISDINIIHVERTELRTVQSSDEDQLIIPRLFQVKKLYKLLSLFDELKATCSQPKGYYRYRASLLLGEMLLYVADDWLEQSNKDVSLTPSYSTFRKFVEFLNDNYMVELEREMLETLMERRYDYLCHVFKKYSNISINQYIHQLRTQRAQYLLSHTSKSVKEIATEVGYQDPLYFSRMFKKYAGVAPLHYRETSV